MPIKVHLVKAMVFPVVMCGCESWTIKKAEHRRIDAFELWCWRRLLRVPWTARHSNQSILKEISPEYSLEGLMLKLKFHYLATWWKELTHWKRSWCWERLKAGGEGNDRGWDGWMAPTTQWTWVWVGSGSWWWTGKPGGLQSMGSQRVTHDWATELNWTELMISHFQFSAFQMVQVLTFPIMKNPLESWMFCKFLQEELYEMEFVQKITDQGIRRWCVCSDSHWLCDPVQVNSSVKSICKWW